jgi:hypothetical protein
VTGTWAAWTPVLQARDGELDLGADALATGSVTQHGSLVVAEFFVRFGVGGETGEGPYLLVPPVRPRVIDEVPRRVGSGTIADHSDGVRHLHVALTANAVIDAHRFLFSTEGRPAGGELIVGRDWPWVWAEDDFLVGLLTYEAG